MIEIKVEGLKPFYGPVIRFATHLLEPGTNIKYIQELLDHYSSKTTEIYTHINQTALSNINGPLDHLDFSRPSHILDAKIKQI